MQTTIATMTPLEGVSALVWILEVQAHIISEDDVGGALDVPLSYIKDAGGDGSGGALLRYP